MHVLTVNNMLGPICIKCQHIGLFWRLVSIFTLIAGVPYSAYSDLLWSSLDGMTEERYKKHLLTDILPSVPGMTEALSKSKPYLILYRCLKEENSFPLTNWWRFPFGWRHDNLSLSRIRADEVATVLSAWPVLGPNVLQFKISFFLVQHNTNVNPTPYL